MPDFVVSGLMRLGFVEDAFNALTLVR